MKFSILSSILLFSWQSSTILAAPLDSRDSINRLDVRVNLIPTPDQVNELIADPSKFADWAKIGEPQIDKAIFFTGQKSQQITQIVNWANGVGLTSVRNIWNSANFYQRGQYKGVDDATFKNFQKAFSTYYADQTKGTAWLVFPQDATPAASGIFWSIELDEIISESKVDKIVWVDQNKITDSTYDWMNEPTIYWQKGQDKPAGA
ncbi:hypothetical protein E0Z10_g7528 [Xylaria hypoxylon]|uniref:Uncharacterized protein n=1 Tax=Xylaria hypoxylon TaxID=37992 RepID=A0A4Z0YPX9_9PEZI|nr:hypothetical protein E0Z10_g7528 [Xylaria hypoxylon]